MHSLLLEHNLLPPFWQIVRFLCYLTAFKLSFCSGRQFAIASISLINTDTRRRDGLLPVYRQTYRLVRGHDKIARPNAMPQSPGEDIQPFVRVAAPDGAEAPGTAAHMSSLLGQLKHTPEIATGDDNDNAYEQRLIRARLGVGSSLFTALRHKHIDAADHSLRVALGCSSWAVALGLEYPLLDEIEVAALLHDVGKIGVPDQVLQKPGTLTDEERLLMNARRLVSVEIARSFGASEAICEIIRLSSAWFCPIEKPALPTKESLPVGARMLAVVDAYDSMTNDQVYRQGMDRDEALEIIRSQAGTQFDPELVENFCSMQTRDQGEIHAQVAHRWLQQLTQPPGTPDWHAAPAQNLTAHAESLTPLFIGRLIASMRDGVVFVDRKLNIRLWNRGAEHLTGVASGDVIDKSWQPSLITLCDIDGSQLRDDECPVRHVMETSVQSIRRLRVTNRAGRSITIDMHIVPVVGNDGGTHGANLLMRDVSSETSLEERVQSLHERATKDPLTQIPNRAEFDRAHQRFIDAHVNRGHPCSLIICDIDHFKKVNDTYGHPAGDEALTVFAQLLARNCRKGDLVARYGGEEFVMLCADCDATTAAERGESIREQLASLPFEMLEGNFITASFGVTQTLPGDTDKAMLRRADDALLSAKEAGRNTVVQDGQVTGEGAASHHGGWFSWWRRQAADPVLKREIVVPVPLQITAGKLQGFIIDHGARASVPQKNHVMLRVDPNRAGVLRRDSDRQVGMVIELELTEERVADGDNVNPNRLGQTLTRVHVSIAPARSRDRRRDDIRHRAERLFSILKSFLVGNAASNTSEYNESTVLTDTDLNPLWLGLNGSPNGD